jgi:hypothetical protein
LNQIVRATPRTPDCIHSGRRMFYNAPSD